MPCKGVNGALIFHTTSLQLACTQRSATRYIIQVCAVLVLHTTAHMASRFSHIFSVARVARRIVKTAGSMLLCYHYVGYPNCIMGPAMTPTFSGEGDWVLVESLPGLVDRVRPGDIVVCWSPVDPHHTIVSRVRALQGEHINVQWEPGAKPVHMQVPQGYMWVKGDAATSREYGPVPLGMLHGRVVAQIWPRMRWIDQEHQPAS